MHPTIVGLFVFACTLGGALLGMRMRNALPRHHLDAESNDTVKLGVGLVATMTALVLGLVTASAKNSYDAVGTAIKQTSIDILVLDRTLARYGPETAEIRKSMQRIVGARIDMIWPKDSSKVANLDPMRSGNGSEVEMLTDAIRALKPSGEFQSALRLRALDRAEELLQARWLLFAGTETSVPLPFLVILVFWLTFTFTSFGLFAPKNGTVITVLVVCALSVGSAVFLILEMDSPFTGLLRVSADPLRYAYAHLNM
jgi:Protein of unknown function (DUF4239)